MRIDWSLPPVAIHCPSAETSQEMTRSVCPRNKAAPKPLQLTTRGCSSLAMQTNLSADTAGPLLEESPSHLILGSNWTCTISSLCPMMYFDTLNSGSDHKTKFISSPIVTIWRPSSSTHNTWRRAPFAACGEPRVATHWPLAGFQTLTSERSPTVTMTYGGGLSSARNHLANGSLRRAFSAHACSSPCVGTAATPSTFSKTGMERTKAHLSSVCQTLTTWSRPAEMSW
mmetsp:Transcript_98499/g.301375  ORF Transcript_98499/g.301375 Transcript_98499/m.301375 type:complete len:228 (+) Transcript_98499:1304-1987(+)